MEEWLDIFSERVKDAESPLPPNDWEVFQAKLKATRRRSRIIPWAAVASIAAAAAVALFMVGGTTDSATEEPADMPLPTAGLLADDPFSTARPEVVHEDQEPQRPLVSSNPDINPILDHDPISSPETTEQPDGPGQADDPARPDQQDDSVNPDQQDDSERPEQTRPSEQATVILRPKAEESDAFHDYETSTNTPSRRRLTVAPHLGGMRSDAAVINSSMEKIAYAPLDQYPNNASPGPYQNMEKDLGEPKSFSNPPFLRNSYTNTISDMSEEHSIPISFGIDLSYPISKRLAITSGVEMSSYKSRFSGKVNNNTLNQRVLYLGIPLRLDLGFWQGGRFSSWIGAGGKVDRCVYARLDGKDVRDNHFNWSVLANAGLRFGVTERIGLYLAPEVSWYFKPDEPVLLTYRTQNPFIFTVNAGLRFDL